MNRIVFITGASGGYGKATAKAFKDNGDTVIMAARNWEKAVATIQEQYGRLDILVNDALFGRGRG